MDRCKRKRATARTAFTKASNALETLLKEEEVDTIEISVAFDFMEQKFEVLSKLSDEVANLMYDDESINRDSIEKEQEEMDQYRKKFLKMRELYRQRQAKNNNSENTVSAAVVNEARRKYKLPKVELVRFTGNVRDWFQFWSFFQKIDQDTTLANEDKFHYLVQAMEPYSRAAELVKGYPPTGDNYEKVIKALKHRFGRKQLQIEVFVRELLELVLQRAMKTTQETNLASLFDKLESRLRALESLGVTTDMCAATLYPLVESAMPEELLRVWQRSCAAENARNATDDDDEDDSQTKLKQLIKFLGNEVAGEDNVTMAAKGFIKENISIEKVRKERTRSDLKNVPSARDLLATRPRELLCIFCEQKSHESAECKKAQDLSLRERTDCAKRRNACYKCLKIGHGAKVCKSFKKCAKCRGRHVDLMCRDKDSERLPEVKKNDKIDNNVAGVASTNAVSNVFMQTMKIKISNGINEIVVRAIIDSGSQRSYITKETVERMKYQPIAEQRMRHLLFGGQQSEIIKHHKYKVRASSLDNNKFSELTLYEQNIICESIPTITHGPWFKELREMNVQLTDVNSATDSIDILLGIDEATRLLTGRVHALKCGLMAIETTLGWTLMGEIPAENKDISMTNIGMLTHQARLEDLWALDSIGITDPLETQSKVARDQEIKAALLETVNQQCDGRYEVQLPWIENHPALPENRKIALSRLQSTVKKLRTTSKFEDYDAIFQEWLVAGIIERVPDRVQQWSKGHYLPHRPVFKENTTTAIRPVFDASAKEEGSTSLNDCLHKGPNLMELVTSVLIRFREGKIGVVSDIKKAFLQIEVNVIDRDALRFFWYDDRGEIIMYRHCRVVFGVCSSPFILSAVIEMHLNQILASTATTAYQTGFRSENILKLKNSFYVDNCVTSVNSERELNDFRYDAQKIMNLAAFDLRGWENSFDENVNNISPVLGINWDKKTDALSIKVSNISIANLNVITKRKILSFTHRIFDPLGFVCPATVVPRILLQETWAQKLNWDDPVVDVISNRFLNWVSQLKDLDKIQIPRCIFGEINDTKRITLHTFCDASKIAYAAVIFARIEDCDNVQIKFVQSKTRIAPMTNKKDARVSIPRLELLAATIGARLTDTVLKSITYKNIDVRYWTDSSTVLSWLKRKDNWSVFVANRVSEIQKLSEIDRWGHVSGDQNPADLPSRGCTVKQLLSSKWWDGPQWLRDPPEIWSTNILKYNEEEIGRELKKSAIKVSGACSLFNPAIFENDDKWYKNFSNFDKIVRVLAWIKRFIINCKSNSLNRMEGDIHASEIEYAEKNIARIIQAECFNEKALEQIKHLLPFIDKEGVLRIKTKLFYRDDSFNFRCPVLLPRKHALVSLIIEREHKRLNHAGVLTTLTVLRENYWILGGRKAIGAVIKKCIDCRRHDVQPISASTAPLPLNRVKDSAIFEVIGVDFAGPIYLKGGQKAWISLFTCAIYRAVHLELVNSLSVASFLMALRRFIARRGRPKTIYSDNGTNFAGLNNALRKIDFEKLKSLGAKQRIEWRLNPPSAPWWGGFWERLIGILKRLLRRSLKRASLSYEEMFTTLTDCEAIINARPITFVADNENELIPLTPAMFLLDLTENSVIDLDYAESIDFGKRYAYRQEIKRKLRERFRSEYLGALEYQKNKRTNVKEIKIGDLVLIGNDVTKRLDWPLARVVDKVYGKDGNVRVLKLTTAKGDIIRPIQRVYPLEINYVDDKEPEVENIIKKRYNTMSESESESDICTFALRTEHFQQKYEPDRCLFTLDTRPKALRQLYEAAAAVAVRTLDSLRRDRDAASPVDMFICTPILGKRRRDQSLDIEKRVPRAIEDLRRWTSAEALGDVTVTPDCTSRILSDTVDDSQPVDHKLPSPEEQVQAVALKFPAEIVAVDVSGRGFRRMSMRRKSMHTGQESHEPIRRRSRPRRPRGKRRNTIAGTDQKEIRQAVGGETTTEEANVSNSTSKRAHRSASSDLLGSSNKDSSIEKKSHFNTLKAWGKSRLKLMNSKSSQEQNHSCADVNESTMSPSNSASEQRSSRYQQAEDEILEADDIAYETLANSISRRARRESGKSYHERKPSSSSSSGKSTSSLVAKQQPNGIVAKEDAGLEQQLDRPLAQQVTSTSRQSSVKLRESAAERRERRKASSRPDEPPHSSSGNWSASSESGRASIGSETTTTTHPPRSTTTASIGTSMTSLPHGRRFKGRDTSASSSVTSEGTLTPDIIHDINAVPFSDDGETSSVYSCDTEGYYTSFHVDSGLKTLREEEPLTPQSPQVKTNEVQSDPTSPIVENEYELFGRGSTSTTTSSAGTVCTTLMAPPPPERKSSLTVVAMVHGQKQNGGESPDSGHNTSSSPVESASSPACTGRSCSEFEYSESSDLEGCERIERIRSKTAINTSRIPSMCVITPPGSDDEHNKDVASKETRSKKEKNACQTPEGSVLMSATVGTSRMEVINGQDKNLYATVQTIVPPTSTNAEKAGTAQVTKVSPLSGMLGKLRGVLPGRKHQQKAGLGQGIGYQQQTDSGDYVTIADVRNNNNKRQDGTTPTTVRSTSATYANADLFKRDAEYVSLSELPKKQDSSLERRRQGARVTLDSEGKVVYSSDSLRRRKGARTTFIPGPFVKDMPSSPAPSPLLHRAQITPRAVQRTTADAVDGEVKPSSEATTTVVPQQQHHQQQPGKVIIRAAKSPDRAASPDYVRTPATVVGPTPNATSAAAQRQTRQGAYVNVQGNGSEEKTLLIIQPTEPVSTSACPPQQKHQQEPPPYVGPPQVPKIRDEYSYQIMYDGQQLPNNLQSQLRQNLITNNQQHSLCHQPSYHHQHQPNSNQITNTYQQLICDKSSLIQQHLQKPYSNYAENSLMYVPNLCHPLQSYEKTQQQQFYTLPNRRPQREVIMEPPRSITPDITRGLSRGSLSAMHMLARQGQKSNSVEKLASHNQNQVSHNYQMDLNKKNLEQFETNCKLSQQKQASADVKNRLASPFGLSALGYRFFASSIQDGLKELPISPIGPEHANGIKASTPTGRVTPSVAERLALQSQRCASPNPALMHNTSSEKHLASDSGRSTPTHLLLSPIKSTMSNEELFAAIHKSKRRLNIKDDPESLSPAGSLISLTKNQQVIGTRHSWSPESQKAPEIPKTILSPSATSRMDFKRLLLQQSIKAGPTRISAAEQLKLSRQQSLESPQQQTASPLKSSQQSPLTKVLSPRSVWRFQTPRSDVLSSTIIEDAAAEEKAMKPSPENPTPAPRFPTMPRRQLNLSGEKHDSKDLEELKNVINDNKNQRALEKRDKELENRLQAIDLDEGRIRLEGSNNRNELDNPMKAIESRRMSNQLARAQFLANSAPGTATGSHKDFFGKRFRARSESPQQNAPRAVANAAITAPTNAVSRSPSAPALETAL